MANCAVVARTLALASGAAFCPSGTGMAQAPLPTVSFPPPRPETIALLILSPATAGYPLTEVYAATRRPLERHTALQVAPLEAIGLAERDAAIRECAGNAECFVRRVRVARDVDLLLTVSVHRPEEDLLLGLRLIDTESRDQVGATGDEVPGGMSLERAIERRLADIVPARVWGEVSSARIESEPSAAEVSFAGHTCVTPCTFERMVPGQYPIVLRKAGRVPWKELVTLQRGEVTLVEATLRKPEQPLLENPWFWAGLGAVLVAGSIGGYLLFQERDRDVVLCFSRDPSDCDAR